MEAATNKQLMQAAFARLAEGDARPLVRLMSDDFKWTVIGSTRWSRCYDGKPAVLAELLKPLADRLAVPLRNRASRIIAENDMVVVECRGQAVTKRGAPYENTYCFVCRFADGQLRELTEYCDTQLIAEVL